MTDQTAIMSWLETLAAEGPGTRTAERLKQALAQNPSRASYASISEMSTLAGINGASVTRAAQSWGFDGWPDLRLELRSRYLESLSLREVALERRAGSTSDRVAASLDADRRALASTSSTLDLDSVRTVACAAAGARRRVAVGGGTYRVLAELVSTYFTLAGYPTISSGETSGLVATLTDLGEGDLLIGFDLWRGYSATLEALAVAHDNGAEVCLITDRGSSHVGDSVDHLFHVSSESSTFITTLVPAVAVVNALATELAALHEAITEASSQRFEQIWRRMGFDERR